MDNDTASERREPHMHRTAIIAALIVILLLVVMARRWQNIRDIAHIPVPERVTIPPNLPAEPIALTYIPLPDERVDLLGMLRVRDASTALDRLDAFLQAVYPEWDRTKIEETVAEAGINLQRLRTGEHAAIFAHKPDLASLPPWITGLLPAPSYEHPADSSLPRHYASFNRYTLFASEQDDLDDVLPQHNALYEIAQAPIGGGLSLTLNLRDIWDHYGSSAKLWFPVGRGIIGLQLLDSPFFGDHPEAVETISDMIGTTAHMLFDLLDASQSLTLDVNLTEEQAEVDLTFEARPDSLMKKLLSVGPVAAPDLLSLLPETPGTLMITQETISDWTMVQELYRRLMAVESAPHLPTRGGWDEGLRNEEKAPIPEDEDLEKIIALMENCGQTTVATHLKVASDAGKPGAVSSDVLLLAENPDAMIELIQRHLQRMFKSGFNADLYRMLGLAATVRMEDEESPEFDSPLYRISVEIGPDPDAPGLLPAHAALGAATTLVFEFAKLGPYVLLTSETSIDRLAYIIRQPALPTGHVLFQIFEPGMVEVGRFYPAALANMIQRSIPRASREPIDAVAMPPVNVAAYKQDGRWLTRIRVPTRTLATIRELITTPEEHHHDSEDEESVRRDGR